METGETTLITKMGGIYNHAQFSPIDPNLILLDQDGWENSYVQIGLSGSLRLWDFLLFNTLKVKPITLSKVYK